MGNVVITILLGLVTNCLSFYAEKGIKAFSERKEQERLKKEIESWCDNFIRENETTVVSGDAFADYLNYYNLIANFFDFIISPNGETEDSFLKKCVKNVKEYYKDKKSLSYDDSRAIKDFIYGGFEIIRKFYYSKIPTELLGLNYELSQLTAITKRTCDSNEEIVSVVKKSQEGIETIIEILSNNSEKKTIPSKIVFKKTYQMPQNTINRTIAKYKELQEGFYSKIQYEDIIEACMREKKIVLLGEAGSGKSIVVEQTAAMACNTIYYPIIYNLKNYVGESIDQIIINEYEGVDFSNIFLIFDAFDEIGEKYKNDFVKHISFFLKKNNDTIVLITSRSNFYSFSDNDQDNGLFIGFKEFGICPIRRQEAETFIEQKGLSAEAFYCEIQKNNLLDLVSIPFYLVELVELFRRNGSFPPKQEIIEKMVENRFSKDAKKFFLQEKLEDYEYEIFDNLEKVSFALQSMRATQISNRDFQCLFCDANQRNRIECSGVFSKDKKRLWGFEHNIFREYFLAKYLNRFNIQTIKELIFDSNGKIFESWENVLSFLILIRENKDLLLLISENDLEMLVKFEKSRVDESKRTEIVINILNDFAEKNVWLSRGRNSASSLANFGQSISLCDFLLDQIKNPVNFRALSNAISVLSEFSTLFEKDIEIKNILFNCVKSVSNREYERIRALDAIVSLNLQDEEITSYVVNELCLEQNDNFKLAKLKYLNSLDIFEDYIDVFADEFSKWNTNGMFELRHESLTAFSKMKRVHSLCKIIHLFSKCGEAFSFDLDVYDKVIEKSVEHYFCGNTEIFDSFIDIIPNAMIINHLFFNKCVEFFEKTKTKAIASLRLVEKYLKNDDKHLIFAIIKIADDECHSLLLERFGEEPQKYKKAVEPIANYTYRLTNVYKNNEAELEARGINIVKPDPSFDHSEAMKRGRQYCFDCLFEREKFIELLKKMIEKTNNANITFSEFSKLNFNPVNYDNTNNKIEEYAQLEISVFLGNWDGKRRIVEAIENINNWEHFIIDFSCRLLVSEESIDVSETQRQFFEKYCNDFINKIDLDNEITDTENLISYTSRIQDFVFLSEHFDFVYEKAIFKKMLKIPNFLFPSHRVNFLEKLPTYLTNHLSKDDLNDQVQTNLSEMTMCPSAADAHIEYCLDNGFDWAVNIAEAICSDEKSPSLRKRTSIDYLIKIKGLDYVYDKYLQTDDLVLLDEIVSLTREHKDERLKKRIESVNRKSKDRKKYLNTLIYLGSRYGLQMYYETIKTAMKSNVEIDDSYPDSAPDIISYVNDIALLDIINDLRKLLFSEGFVDNDYYNLFNGLYNAYSNMAKKNYATIKKCLEEALENKNISDNEKSFCNSLLMTIDKSYYQSKNKSWTVSEIKEFWDKHPI